jgi:hypothetical protein
MVEWTTPFTIGITNVGFNSEYTTSTNSLGYIHSPINLKNRERMSQPPPSLILHTLTAQCGLTDYDVCKVLQHSTPSSEELYLT